MWRGAGEGTVSISFKYTEEEYVRAVRMFYARAYHTRFNFWLGAVVATLGVSGLALSAATLLPLLCLVVGPVLLAFNYVSHFVTPRRQYRLNPKFREPYELDFSEGGIRFRSKGADSRIEWGFYSKAWENEEFYLLFYGKDMFSVIPKRAFRDRLREEAFRSMLVGKLGPLTWPRELPKAREREPEYEPPASPPDWR
jgi:hypothetical protein